MRINETRDVARMIEGYSDYTQITNKPKINGVELVGDKTSEDLGINEGTTNYAELTNKPQINGTELTGNKTSEELGIEGRSSIVAKMHTIIASLNTGTRITDTEDVALLNDIISGNVSVFVLECNDSENDRHYYYYITGVYPDIISFTDLDTSYEFNYVNDHWEFVTA